MKNNNNKTISWWSYTFNNKFLYKMRNFIYYAIWLWTLIPIYLLFSFIAMNWNPLEWLLITTMFGRIIFSILGYAYLGMFINFYDETDIDELY